MLICPFILTINLELDSLKYLWPPGLSDHFAAAGFSGQDQRTADAAAEAQAPEDQAASRGLEGYCQAG